MDSSRFVQGCDQHVEAPVAVDVSEAHLAKAAVEAFVLHARSEIAKPAERAVRLLYGEEADLGVGKGVSVTACTR